jgi:hypothetical protein
LGDAVFKLLASGRISPRRTTGLAYIASLLLRTLPAINNQLAGNLAAQYEIAVPARGSFIISRPEPTIPKEPTIPGEDDPQGPAPGDHASQQPAAQAPAAPEIPMTSARPPQAPVTQAVIPQAPPPNFPHLPTVGSPVWAGPSFSRSPFRSVPLFRRTHPQTSRTWKPRFDAVASGTVHCAYASDV